MFTFQSTLSAPLNSMMSKTNLLLCEIKGTYDKKFNTIHFHLPILHLKIFTYNFL